MPMQPPVAAPAATPLVIQALNRGLGARVSIEKPSAPTDSFVVVSRIGGDPETFATANPRYLVECYAPDYLEAEQFAEDAAHAWRTMRSHNARLGHSYTDRIVHFDDPDERFVRFQFTAGVSILLNHA